MMALYPSSQFKPAIKRGLLQDVDDSPSDYDQTPVLDTPEIWKIMIHYTMNENFFA